MKQLLTVAATIAFMQCGLAQESAPVASGTGSDDHELRVRLQTGGLVLLFRHGNTGPDSDRPDAVSGRRTFEGSTRERQAAYYDCERQRNLSARGRAEMTAVANAIRELGLIIGEVFASPMCRTRESAWLLAGRVEPSDALIGPDNADRRQLVSSVPDATSNRILVSHGYVVQGVVPNPQQRSERGQLPRGYVHVLEPFGDGKFRVLAELGPSDWARLAQLTRR